MRIGMWVVAGVLGTLPGAYGQSALRTEALLPPETMLYVGTDDIEAMRAGMRSSPVGKILAEQEVKEFLEKPLTELRKAIDQGLAMAKQQPALANIDLTPERLMAGPYGRAFIAITHFGLPAGDGGEMAVDPGVVFGLETMQGGMDLIRTVQQIIVAAMKVEGAPPATVDSITSNGFTYDRIKAADAPFALCFGTVGNLSLMTLSERAMTAIAQRAGGASMESLATSADFKRCASTVGASARGDAVAYVQLGRLMQVARAGIELGMKMDGSKELPVVSKMFDTLNFGAMGPSCTISGWRDGVAVTTSYSEIDRAQSGLASLLKPMAIDRELLKLIPKDALSFSLGSFEIAPLWDLVMGGLQLASPEMYGQAMGAIRNAETMVAGADAQGNPNWDIRRDLIGSVGGRMMSMSVPGPGTMMGPGGDNVMWMETPNPAGLEKSLGYLFALPGTMAGFPINFKEQTHGDVKLHVLDPMSLGPAAAVAGSLSLTWAIHDGKFWFSTSSKAMKKALDARTTPPAENVTAKADFASRFVEPPQGAVLTSLSYSDTAANFENTYTGVLGMIPMVMMGLQGQAGMGELPIDLALLPTAEAISKHLYGTVTTSWTAGNGNVSVSRGPFGMESMGAVVAMAGGVGVLAGVRQARTAAATPSRAPAEVSKPASDPTAQARRQLEELGSAITVYQIEYGTAPATLDELTKSKPEYPDGFLGGAALPQDPWGHAFAYVVAGDSYTLWSFGPNGADDKGAGDDIVHLK